jgi:FAD/FMN-containing dehydrogenase
LGGGTGLVGGAIASPDEILLSTERLRRIEEIDPIGRTAIVQAGVTLKTLQSAAADANLFFPLDLGARGTATIGGTVSTNAGGNRVIRYGMMRDSVLGLEVVLADGTIVSSMNRLIKNNAGYDLKQLFIGSEGTLGIITRAVLRLREKGLSQIVALLALHSFDKVAPTLKTLDQRLGGTLSAFEVMWPEFYSLVTSPPARHAGPLPSGSALYCLVESTGGDDAIDRERFVSVLNDLIESDTVADAVVAESEAQAAAMWALRDDVEQILRIGPVFMFDVSLPIRSMDAYIETVRSALAMRWSDAICVVWGHVGDCNLHLWITVQDASDEAHHQVERVVYEPLAAIGGSISAEHGIGTEKRDYLHHSRSAEERQIMLAFKQTLDPLGILNPGRVLATG